MSVRTGSLTPDGVRTMFDRIAPVYDAMNRAMTAGLDRGWRRAAAEAVASPGVHVLDCCCGTGDLAIACARRGARVTGVDFSQAMLDRARRKAPALEWVRGDALALPFADGSFDAAAIAFGIRNVADLDRGLGELARVVRRGGRVAVLELTEPRGLSRPFFGVWFDVVIPLAGRLIRGGTAYGYLPASVKRFPAPGALARALRAAGLEDVHHRRLGGGIVALHVGTRS